MRVCCLSILKYIRALQVFMYLLLAMHLQGQDGYPSYPALLLSFGRARCQTLTLHVCRMQLIISKASAVYQDVAGSEQNATMEEHF